MKKNTAFSILVLFTFLQAYPQDKFHGDVFSIAAGPSFPVGHYSGQHLEDIKAGFATPGEQLTISFEHKLNKMVAVAAVLYGTGNPIGAGSMEKQLNSTKFYNNTVYTGTGSIPVQPDPNATYSTYPNWKMNKKSWLNAGLLLGPTLDLPLNKTTGNFSLTVKAMAGIMYVSSPYLEGQSITDTAVARITQSSEHAMGFSWLASAGIKYNKCKRIVVQAGIDYRAGKVSFKSATAGFSTMKYSGNDIVSVSNASLTTTAQQSIAMINLNIGIGIKL